MTAPPTRPIDPWVQRRFNTYAVLRNLRFGDAFVMLFYLHDLKLDLAAAGGLIAVEKLVISFSEVPLALLADRTGRRRSLMLGFATSALAFVALGIAALVATPLPWAMSAAVVLGLGEAQRTGTHKSIIFDWLDRLGAREHKRRVIAEQRAYSKTFAGIASLAGGITVWLTGSFAPLFWASVVPTALVVPLMISYPKMLDEVPPGSRPASTPGRRMAWLRWPKASTMALVGPSVLFESNLKLAQSWLQPVFEQSVGGLGLAVVGGAGAVALGAYDFVSGIFAGRAAIWGAHWAGLWGENVSLIRAHGAAALLLAGAGVSLALGVDLLALGLMAGLLALQNARRPIFLSRMEDAMDPAWRTTTLSLESQSRGICHAILAVSVGAMADSIGLLWPAFLVLAVGPAIAWGWSFRAPAV